MIGPAPKDGTPYLAIVDGERVGIAAFLYGRPCIVQPPERYEAVTHWMPIPEAPHVRDE